MTLWMSDAACSQDYYIIEGQFYLLCQCLGQRRFAGGSEARKRIAIRLESIEPVNRAAVLTHLRTDMRL